MPSTQSRCDCEALPLNSVVVPEQYLTASSILSFKRLEEEHFRCSAFIFLYEFYTRVISHSIAASARDCFPTHTREPRLPFCLHTRLRSLSGYPTTKDDLTAADVPNAVTQLPEESKWRKKSSCFSHQVVCENLKDCPWPSSNTVDINPLLSRFLSLAKASCHTYTVQNSNKTC